MLRPGTADASAAVYIERADNGKKREEVPEKYFEVQPE